MDKNTSVFTTKKIVVALETITTVIHDYEGEWQFLGNSDVTMEDLLMVSIKQILEIDDTIEKVLDMKQGQEAYRLPNGEWSFSKLEY